MLALRPLTAVDVRPLERFAQRQWPLSFHPGGLGWQLATGDFSHDNATLAHRGGDIVAWVATQEPNVLYPRSQITLHGSSGDPEAGAALLEHALAEVGDAAVDLLVLEGDDGLRSLATGTGFTVAEENVFGEWMWRSATEERIVLPEGYRIRPVGPGEETARVECHRTAWKPSDLPWPERVGPVDPALTSRFGRERYDATRAALLYDRELDLVVEGPDGALVACCVVWWDSENRCSEIEPLGVVPAHRRKGLAVALVLRACALTARRGGDRVYINTSPGEAYPAPARTYATAGFAPVARGTVYTLPAR
ncbi:GNAT family N-acetyltransferase [Nocardiopsis sp. MG754419]|uniref:GNAT family N-acetyltransferase n=1 Tax=Nocardiopsis sp. MG754419 TaxID=2259865 RepID=UPI001BA6A338|nr:GNAT family N-acetyltransferase [Nocardiopsis sp. MG754419]MBR8741613.1 GNAT family N-acetyltransferase [Nocardiopsis sp. MG754419]